MASPNGCLLPVSVSTPAGGHRQQPLQSSPPLEAETIATFKAPREAGLKPQRPTLAVFNQPLETLMRRTHSLALLLTLVAIQASAQSADGITSLNQDQALPACRATAPAFR